MAHFSLGWTEKLTRIDYLHILCVQSAISQCSAIKWINEYGLFHGPLPESVVRKFLLDDPVMLFAIANHVVNTPNQKRLLEVAINILASLKNTDKKPMFWL